MMTPLIAEGAWRALLDELPAWQPPLMRTVVVAPHPDDETLAAGGLIYRLRAAGVEVMVTAVTDGENAYTDAAGLGPVREREQAEALALLGVGGPEIARLRLPDSGLSGCEAQVEAELLGLIASDSNSEPGAETHVIAPWPHDFHPDHEVCGRAAAKITRKIGCRLTYSFFWTWHRGSLDLLDGLGCVRFPLSREACAAKQRALSCHRSQLEHAGGEPILPDELLAPVRRPYEVFLPACI